MSRPARHRPSRRSRRPEIVEKLAPLDSGYDNWKAFLESQAVSEDPKLCQVLATFGQPLRTMAREESGYEARKLAGFPWVTPIIGSGCVGQPDDDQLAALLTLPGRAAAALRGVDVPGGIEADRFVRGFAVSLLTQRVPELRGGLFVDADEVFVPSTDDQNVARCLLAAGLIWRAWHEVAARSTGHVRRSDYLQVAAGDAGAELRKTRLAPAKQSLAIVADNLRDEGSPLVGMRDVLARIGERLQQLLDGQPDRLSGHGIEGLVEIAWLMMITPQGLYPGWHDLMTATALQASLQNEYDPRERQVDFARPRPTLRNVREAVRLAASNVTLTSATARSWGHWELGADRPASSRLDFYGAVADLLAAQLDYGDANSPIAAAFVTSMDVELEMALVDRERKFTLLIPYYFMFAEDGALEHRAMLYWLAATIEPTKAMFADGFDLKKADFTWREAGELLHREQDGIVIVRLVGSPLMPVPDPRTIVRDPMTGEEYWPRESLLSYVAGRAAAGSGATSSQTFNDTYRSQRLIPAYLLDEYSGMHQLLATAQGSLPGNVVELSPQWIFRYWLAVGVQVDDELVRLVLAAHVDTSSGVRSLVHHHGVMVNRTVSRAEADLLSWQGFDAVQSPYGSVTDSIAHYADHLRWRNAEAPTSRDPEQSFDPQDCEVR